MNKILVSTVTEPIDDGLDILLREVNKYDTGFSYAQQKTLDDEVLLCITFQGENTSRKLEYVQCIISDFLKIHQYPVRFVVEFDVTEKDRKYLTVYFHDYLITKNQNGYLLFRKRSKY
jgi:hypothetical protein